MNSGDVRRSAEVSRDGRYRYTLGRSWSRNLFGDRGRIAFIGLNPSTADGREDDPTITRLIARARDWGYSSLVMLNLYAFRATDPADLWKFAGDRIGPENNFRLLDESRASSCVVCCWGTGGARDCRGPNVALLLQLAGLSLYCLGQTADGSPAHPLYLPADRSLSPYCPKAGTPADLEAVARMADRLGIISPQVLAMLGPAGLSGGATPGGLQANVPEVKPRAKRTRRRGRQQAAPDSGAVQNLPVAGSNVGGVAPAES